MATYTIREVAQRFHVQTSTLRYYEDQGLLCDVERDDAGRRVTPTRISGGSRRSPASNMRA